MKLVRIIMILSACMLSSGACRAGNSVLAWPEAKPGTGPWTRWWWLGSAVDDSSLAFRMGEMKKAGIEGVEITPIYGARGFEEDFIDFLSPKWMSALSFAVTTGNRLGLGVDMDTGTGWPFGGGPAVTQELAAAKAIFMKYELKPGGSLAESIAVKDERQKDVAKLALVMAYPEKGKAVNLTRLVSPDGRLRFKADNGALKIVAVFTGKTLQKVKRAGPGGEGWVMDHFSRKTLDAYLGRFEQAFRSSGCPVPRHFFNDSYEVYGADWTPDMFNEFARRRGYRLEEHLLEFLGDGDADRVARVKCDYRETVSDMLMDHFTIPWTAWAHRMGSLTRSQAHGSPGNLVDLYGAADIPECESFGATWFDIPGFRWEGEVRMSEANPVLMKFASSAAHLNGGRYASSETFTWLTEHFRTGLSQCKPQLDQMFCAGVNHVVFHGTPYSPKNAPWPGWQFYASVNFSSYNTIWRDIEPFTRYIARCQSFLQWGSPDNAFLVYWPLHDLWTSLKGDPFFPFSRSMDEWLVPSSFFRLVRTLRKSGYDADFVSDRYLEKAKVVDGRVTMPGGNSYSVLAVPSCKVMSPATAEKIVSLAGAGAKVMFMETLPSEVPGLARADKRKKGMAKSFGMLPVRGPFESERSDIFGKGMVVTGKDMEKTIALCGQGREEIADLGIQFIRRKNPGGHHYFFSNLHSQELDGWVALGVSASSAALFDPLTGSTGMARLRKEGTKTQIYLQLKPGQSVILKTFSAPMAGGESEAWSCFGKSGDPVEPAGPWTLSFMDGEPRIDGKYRMDRLVSWTELDTGRVKVFAGTGRYSMTFNLPEANADEWVLDLGQVNESARVFINGKAVGTLWSLPFRANVGSFLVPGQNLIEVEVTNAPANRIADLDKRKVEWKFFYDINVANRAYKPFDASGWEPMQSGLIGPVTLTPQRRMFQEK
jgi:hypothetical protein